jgi:Fe-S-cluster containining protein
MIRVPAPLFYLRSLRLLFLWWQRSVNGFERLAEDRRGRTFVFRCTHFDPITRLCDSYASRPGMCRDYPRVLLDGPAPEFLPGCTHRAVDPGAASFREALDELDLDPDVRARVEERLHLRE